MSVHRMGRSGQGVGRAVCAGTDGEVWLGKQQLMIARGVGATNEADDGVELVRCDRVSMVSDAEMMV